MLNLDYNDIENWEEKVKLPDPNNPNNWVENPMCFVFGIFMMHTGINHLTEDNAEEFYMRCKLIEACFDGALMRNGDGTPHPITAAEVKDFIGLRSNASTYTEPQFFTHLRKNVAMELRRAYRMLSKEPTPA